VLSRHLAVRGGEERAADIARRERFDRLREALQSYQEADRPGAKGVRKGRSSRGFSGRLLTDWPDPPTAGATGIVQAERPWPTAMAALLHLD